jgi:hypothetical protein
MLRPRAIFFSAHLGRAPLFSIWFHRGGLVGAFSGEKWTGLEPDSWGPTPEDGWYILRVADALETWCEHSAR